MTRLVGAAWQNRTKLHSMNPLERLSRRISGTLTYEHLPNEGSTIRLISAVLLEVNDEWKLQHRCMQAEDVAEFAAPQIVEAITSLITPRAS